MPAFGAQLTSSNAMLEVTCSSATEAAKRLEIQQHELAACKEKLVEVTTLRELMKIAQTAQGAAEARSKDLQVHDLPCKVYIEVSEV